MSFTQIKKKSRSSEVRILSQDSNMVQTNVIIFKNIVTTLNTLNQLPLLTSSAAKQTIKIICVQKHYFYNRKLDVKYQCCLNF